MSLLASLKEPPVALALLLALLAGTGCTSMENENLLTPLEFAEYCESLMESRESDTGTEPHPPVEHLVDEEIDQEGSMDFENLVFVDDNESYSFELRGATLGNAITMIVEAAGINLLLNGDFTEIVEFSFPSVGINDALSLLCRTHRCRIEKKGDVFILSRDNPLKLMTRIYQLNSTPATGMDEMIKSMIGEEANVIINTANNIITVSATRAAHENVERFIRSVDRSEKQVLIEAKIIEFSLTDLHELGAMIDLANIHVDDTTAQFISNLLTASNDVEFTIAGDNADVNGALRMLSKLTRVNVISRPNVVAKSGKEATIDITEEIPYVETTVTTNVDPTQQGVGSQTMESVEFKEVGIKLKVTPLIMKDGCVSLSIDQDVSEQIDTFNGVPVINHRHIVTEFGVQDRNTIVIGGLLKEYKFDERSGVPFLRDLPLLGFFFRGTETKTEKIELIVMITPTLVDPKAAGEIPSSFKMKIARSEKDESGSTGVVSDGG